MTSRRSSQLLRHLLAAAGAFALAASCRPPQATVVSPADGSEELLVRHEPPVADSSMRQAIAERFPSGVGALGERPLLWFIADSTDRALRVATGRDGLERPIDGREQLTWAAAARKLQGMPESAQPGDLLFWGTVTSDGVSVDVVWVRLHAGAAALRTM